MSYLTKDERSLLLYLESCAVDRHSEINRSNMNATDEQILRQWQIDGFVRVEDSTRPRTRRNGDRVCRLSDEAWRIAHCERRARAERALPDHEAEREGEG